MSGIRIRTQSVLSVAVLGLLTFTLIGLLPIGATSHARPGAAVPLAHIASPSVARPAITPFHTVATPGAALPSPHALRLGHFSLPGPHPRAWGPSGLPPGAEALGPMASGGWGGGGGGGYATNWSNRLCAGLWPSFESVPGLTSQGAYASGCYGHDEPGINFLSNLPGSGGNVSWNVTLPKDRDATHNQSDLYAAIWFGMTMSDPYAWMDQCFLELQFYPDQTFFNPGPGYPNWTVNGQWIGAAVAWQIEASTGFEDPCFYQPLYLNGVPGTFFNMTEGDQISVTMTGWPTSGTGEYLSIIDKNSGYGSNLTMYNYAQGYPINPAYDRSNIQASLQWTPGGELPVSFAFETGHAGNPAWPSSNPYGGCSGGPVATAADPAAPCPSYDPGSWANDTKTPWKIQAPVFSNGKSLDHPTQVAFTQPEGGIPLVDQTSNGVCNGIEGSAWCSYPWYSYYCSSHLFEFGAIDYPGVSSDFGKYSQFSSNLETQSFGGSFFPPTNFSTPSCAKANGTVTVGPSGAGGGSVYFLHDAYATATSLPSILDGTYSLHAIPAAGYGFSHWTTTGAVAVAISTSAYTTVKVSGTGAIAAVFTTAPTTTSITFHDNPKGSIGLDPSFLWTGDDHALATLPAGGSFALAPGIYSIQAYPKPGWNFTRWSSSGGVIIGASQFPYTQLIVTGATKVANVTAWYTASPTNGTIVLYTVGAGVAKFGTLSVANPSPFSYNVGYATMPVGTYPIKITGAKGTLSWQILYGPPLIISNNSISTFGNLEGGTAVLEVIFNSAAQVTFQVSVAKGGAIYPDGATTPLPLNTPLSMALGTYEFVAAPAPGYAFTGWVTKNASTISFSTLALDTYATILGNGRITATFVKTTSTSALTFKTAPNARAGNITFDVGATYAGGTKLLSIASGQHVVTAHPAAGWMFVGWKATGRATLIGASTDPTTVLSLTAGGGAIVATFAEVTYPVSFALWNPHSSGLPAGTLTIAGVSLHPGDSVWLVPGTYTITLAAAHPVAEWAIAGAGLAVTVTTTSTTVTVTGAGTLEAILQ